MHPSLRAACDAIAAAVRQQMQTHTPPLVVALDGASGAGKSTLAPLLAAELAAALIPTDDFFSAHIPDADWDRFTVAERYAQVLDWARIRADVLAPLRSGQPARWHAFDFASGLRADGTYGMEAAVQARHPADVIVLEGAYSAAPYLADLLDLRVLLDLPRAERHARLRAREDPEFLRAWHARWDEVEAYYRREVKPPSAYDLVIELTS